MRRSTTPIAALRRCASGVGGRARDVDHRAPGDHHRVARLPYDAGRAELDEVLAFGHLVAHRAVQRNGLEHEHGIGIAHGGGEQTLGVRCGRRHDDLEPGCVGERRLDRVGVVLGRAHTAAVRHADGDGAVEPAATAVAQPRHLTHDLVVRLRAEARELDLCDRHEARRGEAHARSDDRGLGDRRVEHARVAEPVEETVGDAEHAAVAADVLAEEDHAVVARHLVHDRVVDRGEHVHDRHDTSAGACPSSLPGLDCDASIRSSSSAR